ncbi:hypothetical protein K8O93_00725 [Gordonia bronchialis]|uniref:hypothetical protein n=1 Tax=Gordonia bronchialis TaxID=2054 RepID=UPI001CBD2C16|nr:hypothetical protein [Gordonia bronchialis]UAK38357.1 hypothetical protein K8O93_00725 [Gordonia bronchialis]
MSNEQLIEYVESLVDATRRRGPVVEPTISDLVEIGETALLRAIGAAELSARLDSGLFETEGHHDSA